MGDAAHKWMRCSLLNMDYDRQLKERDGYFFEGLEHFKQYFLCIADGFQDLSKAFHYPIQ
jgi:hypothetical protein